MASPQDNQMAIASETAYGTPNTTTGVRAYGVQGSSWTKTANIIKTQGQRAGIQAQLARTVRTVIKGYAGSYTRWLNSHAEELWWLDTIGVHNAAPTVIAPSTTPPTYTKTYSTHKDGPTGSYTIIQDEFKDKGTPPHGVERFVYSGVTATKWGIKTSVENGVEVNTDFVARTRTKTEVTGPLTAVYPSATDGLAQDYHWADTALYIGAAGTVAANPVDLLLSFDYQHDNTMAVSRNYIDGTSNMKQPYQMGAGVGTLSLSFEYGDDNDSLIDDNFIQDNQISARIVMTRGIYSVVLWIPNLHLDDVPDPVTAVSGASTLSATATTTWDESPTVPVAQLTIVTEGSTNP